MGAAADKKTTLSGNSPGTFRNSLILNHLNSFPSTTLEQGEKKEKPEGAMKRWQGEEEVEDK